MRWRRPQTAAEREPVHKCTLKRSSRRPVKARWCCSARSSVSHERGRQTVTQALQQAAKATAVPRPNITLQEPVHGHRSLEILADVPNGSRLGSRQGKGKERLELGVERVVGGTGGRLGGADAVSGHHQLQSQQLIKSKTSAAVRFQIRRLVGATGELPAEE